MPRTLFRILAAALLALVVPIQGLTAVKAGLCMAMGGHGGEQSHEASAHHHDAAAPAHDHGEAPSEGDHASNAHCPPCVSCCAAAAIASETKIALPEAPPVAVIAAPQYWIAGVLPQKLDRPPLAL
jgi:hypothetical protein